MGNSVQSRSADISRAQAREVIDAATFAWYSDIPLTMILHFQLEKLERRPQEFISDYLKQVGDWLRIQGHPRIYIWVLEKPPGKSVNAHMLLHLPDALRKPFANMQRGWLKQAGLEWEKKVLRYQKIGIKPGSRDRPLGIGEYLMHLEIAVSYLLKGADKKTNAVLRIDQKPQGTISGKRVGISEGISKKARLQAGYEPPASERVTILFNRRSRLSRG